MGVDATATAAAAARGEVPIGVAFVSPDGTLQAATGHGVEATVDATPHAEVVALQAARTATGGWRLAGSPYMPPSSCVRCVRLLRGERG